MGTDWQAHLKGMSTKPKRRPAPVVPVPEEFALRKAQLYIEKAVATDITAQPATFERYAILAELYLHLVEVLRG